MRTEEAVPICNLIQECRLQERTGRECEPYAYEAGPIAPEEEWVLAVRYEERPSRGMTSLSSQGESLAQCEPAMICESHGYGVFRRSMEKSPVAELDSCVETMIKLFSRKIKPSYNDLKPLSDRLDKELENFQKLFNEMPFSLEVKARMCSCVNTILSRLPDLPLAESGNYPDPNEAYQWCRRWKQGLLENIAMHSYGCQAAHEVQAIVCPSPPSKDNLEAFWQGILSVFLASLPLLGLVPIHCICAASLPPCPEPTKDQYVPLANVRIRANECTVLSVCNQDTRRYALNVSNLAYWFGWQTYVSNGLLFAKQKCCPWHARQVPPIDVPDYSPKPSIPPVSSTKPPDIWNVITRNLHKAPTELTAEEIVKAMQRREELKKEFLAVRRKYRHRSSSRS